jgi:hypothetical protein
LMTMSSGSMNSVLERIRRVPLGLAVRASFTRDEPPWSDRIRPGQGGREIHNHRPSQFCSNLKRSCHLAAAVNQHRALRA